MIGTSSTAVDRASVWLLGLAAAAALGVGVLTAATSPLVPVAAVLVVALVVSVGYRPTIGIALFVAVVGLLPFGVIPVAVAGAQLTFVDAVLLTTFASVLARVIFDGLRLPVGAPGAALIAFVCVALAAFAVGAVASPSPVPPELIRRFGKLLVSVLLFLVARALLTSRARLVGLTRGLIFAGAIQGAIGTVLRAMSPLSQLSLLTRLQVLGYPATDVLRYIPGPNNTYTDQLRAIGTSVDPNVFGGTLMLAVALAIVQWGSPRPVLPRWLLVVLALPIGAGVLLSQSRASWLGLGCGLLVIGTLRYRRILLLGAAAGLALLVTPSGQDLISRLVSGFSTADRATAFRVGEYANAVTLLQRYPLLGIGFGNSPDIDVTAGVSSVYLLVAEQTGLLGLVAFASALGLTWWAGMRGFSAMRDEARQGVRAAFLAAFTSALIAGLLDHYFANQVFPHAVALFWLYAAGLVAASELRVELPERQREPERAAQTRPATRRANRASVQGHQMPRN